MGHTRNPCVVRCVGKYEPASRLPGSGTRDTYPESYITKYTLVYEENTLGASTLKIICNARPSRWLGSGTLPAWKTREECAWHLAAGTTPCTLDPTPYALHPTPYTPHPTPYTLHPTPYTLHPLLALCLPSLALSLSRSTSTRTVTRAEVGGWRVEGGGWRLKGEG